MKFQWLKFDLPPLPLPLYFALPLNAPMSIGPEVSWMLIMCLDLKYCTRSCLTCANVVMFPAFNRRCCWRASVVLFIIVATKMLSASCCPVCCSYFASACFPGVEVLLKCVCVEFPIKDLGQKWHVFAGIRQCWRTRRLADPVHRFPNK